MPPPIPPEHIGPEDADRVIHAFYNAFRGTAGLKILHRPTQESFYGPQASIEAVGRIKGAFLPRHQEIHLPLANIRDARDLWRTLRHEALGHYGTLTFTAAQKRGLLEVILDARAEPSLRPIWRRVHRTYASATAQLQAEEVFCLIAEDPRGPAIRPGDAVHRTWQEVVRSRSRRLQRDDLRTIVQWVVEGIRLGARPQQIFPRDDSSQFRIGNPLSRRRG